MLGPAAGRTKQREQQRHIGGGGFHLYASAEPRRGTGGSRGDVREEREATYVKNAIERRTIANGLMAGQTPKLSGLVTVLYGA